MKINYFSSSILIFFLYICFSLNLSAKISNSIIVKVGNEIITSSDLENEIKTILFLSNRNLTQKDINSVKNQAVKSLIKDSIKKIEVKKNKITNYNQDELENYLLKISKNFKTNRPSLKNIFEKNGVDYNSFVEKSKVRLMWKTLIYFKYKNQLGVNMVEVQNEIQNIFQNKKKNLEYELSEIELYYEKNKIENLLKKINKTIAEEGFQNTAKKYSISNSAQNGGKIGLFPENTLSSVYLNEIKKIKMGEITKPIKTPSDSIVILKIDSINEVEVKNLDLEKVKEKIIARKKEEKLELFSRSHYSDLENSTFIKFQ